MHLTSLEHPIKNLIKRCKSEIGILSFQIPPEAQVQLKEQILLSVQNEQTESIRRKVCEVAAEVARNLIDEDGNNQWPEFLQFLFQCANSPLPALKESALRMFT